MPSRATIPLACAIACLFAPDAALASPATWSAAWRYRLESVEQDGFANHGLASTARLRVGGTRPLSARSTAFLEGEAVWAINDEFNSGANGRTAYPVVADASAVEVNQAGVRWQSGNVDATLGRQRVAFDNQRFIGTSGWRQNEQTFDAVLLAVRPSTDTTLHYAWLARVHRVAGDRARDPLARERELDAHLLHATVAMAPGTLAAYAYGIEDRDVATSSSRTLGARWSAAREHGHWRWTAAIEAAQQSDHGNNPLGFAHGYRLLEAGAGRGRLNARLGRERLAGNGTHAFQTPLATLHAFNGWADVFSVTPASGLEDRYASLGGAWVTPAWPSVDWTVAWHEFDRTTDGPAHGTEWNASLGTRLANGWSILLKLADYRAEGFGRDTRKAWLQFEWTR